MYANADFDDDETRNNLLEYFIDKIYVFNDRLVVTWWYSEDKTEIGLNELVEVTDVDLGSTLSCSSPLKLANPNIVMCSDFFEIGVKS